MQQPGTFLFLCGVGRSGTTVFRRSLGLHPQIYYNGFENNLVQDLATVARNNCQLPSRQFAMAVSQEVYDAIFRRACCELIWPDLDLRRRSCWMAAINPAVELLPYLVSLFPGTRLVGLIRNGIEVVASRMRYESFAQQPFQQHCQVWVRSAQVSQWGLEHSDVFQLFRQEWFYQPQLLEEKLSALWEWLGVNCVSEVLENFSGTLVHPTGAGEGQDIQQWSQQAKQDLFRSKSQAWQEWTGDQRRQFQETCGPWMERLGYEIPW